MGRFHAGETEVQRRRGARQAAERVARIIASEIPPRLAAELGRQRIAVVASLDARRRPWASLVTGSPGFVEVVDPHLVRVRPVPPVEPLLAANLAAHPDVGLLVIDLETRQRWRLNGRGQWRPEGLFIVADQVYGNCPKYIHPRRIVATSSTGPVPSSLAKSLDAGQRALVAEADTFFIATWHPQGGADASHRGGAPGFVTLLDDRTLEFPDYPGNHMFNTLGNLAGHPHAGLLFTDFATGDVLQLTGPAWLEGRSALTVRVAIDAVRATPGGSPLRFESVGAAVPLPETGHAGPVRASRG
jgi:predicted pyridoxine 5'-phosphate oxidase superfamily flavin-nucleotide-binding protein